MSDALPRPTAEDLVRHYGLVISGLYLFVSTIGATYYVCLFGTFGLNAFEWWDLSDFFLAAFRRPMVLPFSVIALWIGWTMAYPDQANRYYLAHWPRLARWSGTTFMYRKGWVLRWSVPFALLFAAFWFLLVIYGAALHEAALARAGLSDAVTWRTEDGALHRGHLLATTSQYVAVIVPGGAPGAPRGLAMVPHGNVEQFTLCGERRTLGAALRGDASPCARP